MLFGLLAEEAAEHERLAWDTAVEHFLFRWIPEAHGEGTLVRNLVVFSFLALLVLVPSVLARRGRLREAAFWVVSFGALDAFGLARLVTQSAEPGEYTFPSAGAMLFGALVTASYLLVSDRRRRWALVLSGASLAAIHGAVVVDLRLAYPSDVLAGWLVALAWASAVWLVVVREPARLALGAPSLTSQFKDVLSRPREAEAPAVPHSLGKPELLEPNLFLSFDGLSRRLLALVADEERPSEAAAVDRFLLAAGLNQIVEDDLHRDFLSLWRASSHLPRPLAAVARLGARAGSRLRACGPKTRRLARRQRELDALVARLGEQVAHGVPLEDEGTLAGAQSVLLPLDAFPTRLRRSVQRLPNCFRSFDQHPDDCLRLVQRFVEERPDRTQPLLVVGLRSSGNYLAPLHAAFLRGAGYADVRVITTRPSSLAGRAETRAIAAAAADGAVAILVDDPPRTGRQLAHAGALLRRAGLAEVVLLLQLPGHGHVVPDALDSYPLISLAGHEWTIRDRLRAPAVQSALEELLVGRSVEGPDGAVFVARVGVESIATHPSRRGHVGAHIVARLRGQGTASEIRVPLYAEGVGLGYFGRHAEAVATTLEPFIAPVYGLRDGLLFRAWLPEDARMTPTALRSAPDSVAAEMARYVAIRSRRLALDEDITLRLAGREAAWEHTAQMLGDAFGRLKQFVRPLTHRAARQLLKVARPAVADAATVPWEWFDDGAGRLRKIGFQQRASSNAGFQSCDPVFDLAEAAAAAELAGAGRFEARVRRHYESLTGSPIDDERWLLYRLLHHLRTYKEGLRSASADPSLGEAAFLRVLETERMMSTIYARYFEERYFLDLAPPEEGPLCAIDIDGVLETRWVVFPAIAPAGALALRALHRHGYRAVLVTGRSLDEVRSRCSAYRLAGAVAEYGSVVYDHVGGSERSLLGSAERAALAALRAALAEFDGVYIDQAYRHSVRAHVLGGGGARGGLPPEAIAAVIAKAGVEGQVRPIPGDLQTDFVAAGVDKGRGLTALAEALGAMDDGRPQVALAVGDSASDLPMLELATRAVAVANAGPELRGRVASARAAYQAGLLRAVHAELGHSPRHCAVCRPPRPSSPESRVLLTALSALDGGRRGKVVRALALAAVLARV